MRVLMLSQFYPPMVGGEESMVAAISEGLAERGHDVMVATLALPDAPEHESVGGVEIRRLRTVTGRLGRLYSDSARRHAPPIPDPEVSVRLRRLLRSFRPDVVHGNNWLLRSLLPLRIPDETAVVATLHDFGLVCSTRRLMYRGAPCPGPAPLRCLRCARSHYGLAKGAATVVGNTAMRPLETRRVDLFVAISQAVADGSGLASHGIAHRVIPNFVPDGFGAEATEDADATPGPLVFVGDAVHEKGIDVLLEAYTRLERAPGLVIVGRDEGLGDRRLPEGVRAVGLVPHDEVGRWWRDASVAIVPSLWPEPFGLVALEAAAYGRPVVASRTGGLADVVVDGETGLLVPRGDSRALAAALQRLIDDAPLRRRLGIAARARSAAFRAGTVLPLYEDAYAEALAR